MNNTTYDGTDPVVSGAGFTLEFVSGGDTMLKLRSYSSNQPVFANGDLLVELVSSSTIAVTGYLQTGFQLTDGGSLTVFGDGRLSVSSTQSRGVDVDGSILVKKGAKLSGTSAETTTTYGVLANGGIVVEAGGELEGAGKNGGVRSLGAMTVSGTLTGTATNNAPPTGGVYAGGLLTVNPGGRVIGNFHGPVSSDTAGVYAAKAIVVNGGTLEGRSERLNPTPQWPEAYTALGVISKGGITVDGGGTLIGETKGSNLRYGGDNCVYGVYEKEGNIAVINGSLTGIGGDAGVRCEGDIVLNSGSLFAKALYPSGTSANKACIGVIAENGGVTVNNGVFTAVSQSVPYASLGRNILIKPSEGVTLTCRRAATEPTDWSAAEIPDRGVVVYPDEINVAVSSAHAAIRVANETPPTILFDTQPQDATVTEGSITGNLTAVATVSTGVQPTYNWYKCDAAGNIEGASLGAGGTFPIPTDLSVGTYTYLCQATSPGATPVNSNVAKVTVNAPGGPVIHRPKVDVIVKAILGQSAGFSVRATDATAYQWQMKQGGVWADIPGATRPTFVIQKVTKAHDGLQYRCVVTGAPGTRPTISPMFTIRLPMPPVPATGDDAQPGAWLLALGAAISGAAWLLLARRRALRLDAFSTDRERACS